MLTKTVLREYWRLRRKDWPASQAMHAARVKEAWDAAEAEGLVQMVAEPDPELHDDSYIDTWGLRPCDVEREKKGLWRTIERDGVWMYASQFRVSKDREWETADSIGDCIGDLDDTGYDVSLKSGALDALDKARQDEANVLAERATYAAVTS